MKRATPRVLALTALVVLAPLLGACSSDGGTDGADGADGADSAASSPSSGAGDRHRAECSPSDADGEVIVHPGSITADTPTTLVGASLENPVNLEVVEESVLAFSGRPSVTGVIRDYPPLKTAGVAEGAADWDERRPLRDLKLSPADGQQAVLLALRLVDPTSPGHLDGVDLALDRGDGERVEHLAQPLLVEAADDEVCSVDDYESTLAWVP